MSLKRALKMLEGFGFSRIDAKVYIYLAKTSPQETKDLTMGLNMTEQELLPILKGLQEKRVVINSPERPGLFSALAFEELLNLYIRVNMQQAQIIKETKKELLAAWRKMPAKNNM